VPTSFGHDPFWISLLKVLFVFVVHVWYGVRLTWRNKAARTVGYVCEDTLQANWASRHMLLTGLVILAFVIYHLLPGVWPTLIVLAALGTSNTLLLDAGLSFLGFGIQPPAANWGLMINENRIGLVVNPWAVVVPAGLIAILTIGLNTFTDAIARASLGVNRPAEEMVIATGIVLDTGV